MSKYQVGDLVTVEFKGTISGIRKYGEKLLYTVEIEPEKMVSPSATFLEEKHLLSVQTSDDIIKGV